MADEYTVNVSAPIVEALAGIAVEMGIPNVQDLVEGILKEKIHEMTGVDIDEVVSLTSEEDEVTSELEQALVGQDKVNEFTSLKTDLGPDIDNAPEHYLDEPTQAEVTESQQILQLLQKQEKRFDSIENELENQKKTVADALFGKGRGQ